MTYTAHMRTEQRQLKELQPYHTLQYMIPYTARPSMARPMVLLLYFYLLTCSLASTVQPTTGSYFQRYATRPENFLNKVQFPLNDGNC